MDPKLMKPLGLALHDFFFGGESVSVTIYRDDGFSESLEIKKFFQELHEFSPLEQTALDLCYGRILDVGAGAGRCSLALQKRGMSVCAIDILPEAVEIMHKRGVRNVLHSNFYELKEKQFDTILVLGRAIGFIENLDGLDQFLNHARQLLMPAGQILIDSLNIQYTSDQRHLVYQESNRKAGRYFGELRLRLKYKGHEGNFFRWLLIDPKTLIKHASATGWFCHIIMQEETGVYLARLTVNV